MYCTYNVDLLEVTGIIIYDFNFSLCCSLRFDDQTSICTISSV